MIALPIGYNAGKSRRFWSKPVDTRPYEATEQEIQQIALATGMPASIVGEVLPFLPPNIRPQWIDLLKSDGRAAGRLAMEYGWQLKAHLFED
jgi:hypothetical protein